MTNTIRFAVLSPDGETRQFPARTKARAARAILREIGRRLKDHA